jgi:signal transduction histidine kinase
MNILPELNRRIRYKIILPYAILTLLVAIAGSAIALLFVTGSAQERLNNQLAQQARSVSDTIVATETANLGFLREITFAGPNPYTSAPAVADALARRETAGLERAIEPYFQISAERAIWIDRLIVFDTSGHSIVDWQRPSRNSPPETWIRRAPFNLTSLWFVSPLLRGEQDDLGDKYAGLLNLGDGERYLYVVAPITQGDQIVGGIIAATRLDSFLQELSINAQVAVMTIYNPSDGIAFASTAVPLSGLEQLHIRPNLIDLVRQLPTTRDEQGIFDIVRINERDYQLAYAPLRVRGTVIALISVALASDYVIGPWADVRLPLIFITMLLMAAIIGLGVLVAGRITRPLQELVGTAEAVIAGDLDRRSRVVSNDEVGTLSNSFNEMTGHLLQLYQTVRTEANQRAAIFESITDGIVVTHYNGEIALMNPAMQQLLQLASNDPLPAQFSEIPLLALDETALHFGGRSVGALYQLHDRIVRLTTAPIKHDANTTGGYVHVIQDMTSEVAIDRAKTNFIATISHELRTPLTVIGGNADLLLSGLMGPMHEDQRPMIVTIRQYTTTTTSLINNIITIAGLDSGTINIELSPLALAPLVDDVSRSVRGRMASKHLQFIMNIPADLPDVLADISQLRIVIFQLLDNACRYTETGQIQLAAYCENGLVRVDISDTGAGIEPELRENLFTRFTRGSQGINSAERGIGLGLAIAHEIIEAQQGQIWLDQTSSQGSTFSFTLQQNYEMAENEQSISALA